MPPIDSRTRRGRRSLLLLLAAFFVPAAIAWTLFFSGWRPPATSNHGDLLDTPVQLEVPAMERLAGPGDTSGAPELRGKWTMLMTLQGPCDADCEQRLRETRQIRRALAQNTDRAQRVLVLGEGTQPPDDGLLQRHRDLHVVRTEDTEWARPPRTDSPVALSLVDTRGYQMMHYGEPFDASGMLDDLRHLLRLSNIDIERLDGLTDRD